MRVASHLPFASVLLVAFSAPAFAQIRHYVDDSATGTNDGWTWQNAFTDLQSALAVAGPGHVIWVARGTYKPSSTLDRSATFEIPCDIYGGFDGTEFTLDQRAGLFDETILSGDLLGDDGPGFTGYADNSHNVAYIPPIVILTFDGFTVRGGNADSGPNASGGGLYIAGFCFGATVRNCTFVANHAQGHGGGLRQSKAPTLVERCTFVGNRSRSYGGGMSGNADCTIRSCGFFGNFAGDSGGGLLGGQELVNCLFSGNEALRAGGGAFSPYEDFFNCTFFANTASIGGGVAGSWSNRTDPVNCIFWGNSDATGQTQRGQIGAFATAESCIVQGWDGSLPGSGTFDADPLFRSALGADGIAGTLDDDLSLEIGSPCIDTADAAQYVGVGIDALGMPRFVDSLGCDGDRFRFLDRGAIERQEVDGTSVYCSSLPSSLGVDAEIGGPCTVTSASGPISILARPVPDTRAFLLVGEPGTPLPFGEGKLCLSGTVQRVASGVPSGGLVDLPFDPSGLSPGSTVGLQVLFRDPAAGGTGFNLSSAMRLLVLP